MNIPEKICDNCILPGTFPGIAFNDQGTCNYCQKEAVSSNKINPAEKKNQYRLRLDALIENTKGSAPVYDMIIAYSGGKDSSYTLKLLKERYNLRMVALTFDNHFVSSTAFENIKKVTDSLEIDSITFKPSWRSIKEMFALTAKKDIFSRQTLLRASSICTACICLVKSMVLKTALEMSIPLVGFGWSPGQAPIQSAILKTNPSFSLSTQNVLKNAFPPELIDELHQYFIPDDYFNSFKDSFPHNIHPLAFYDYDEDRIKKELNELGWLAPEDTDTNSSNCLINAYANNCHISRHGFHPYVWEIANMVRQGLISRDLGLIKIYSKQNKTMINYAKRRLTNGAT